MLQLQDPGVSPRANKDASGEEGTPAVTWVSMRWLVGILPWAAIVILLAIIDGGCAPVDEPGGPEEPTPFPYFGDDDDSAGQGDDDDLGGPYPAILRPDFYDVAVSRVQPLWVEFSDEGVAATLSLSLDGEAVPGTSLRVGAVRYLFVPDWPLEPETTYDVRVDWDEDDSLGWSFTTRAARAPVGDPSGVTLAWGLDEAQASSPPGAEAFVSQLPLDILATVSSGGAAVFGGTATGDPPEQDLCVATFDPTEAGPARWEDPLIATPGALLRLSVDLSIVGYGVQQLPLRDVRFAAELEADGDGIVGIAEGSFVGWVDLREVAVPQACETLGGVAIECSPCPGDGEEQCLVFALEEIGGDAVDVELVERTPGQVKADPACMP